MSFNIEIVNQVHLTSNDLELLPKVLYDDVIFSYYVETDDEEQRNLDLMMDDWVLTSLNINGEKYYMYHGFPGDNFYGYLVDHKYDPVLYFDESYCMEEKDDNMDNDNIDDDELKKILQSCDKNLKKDFYSWFAEMTKEDLDKFIIGNENDCTSDDDDDDE